METIYSKYEPLFGSWHIKEKIGQGSIGQVFLIERKEMGFSYRSALKAITVPPDQNDIKTVMANGLTYAETTHYYKTFMDTLSNELTTMAKLKGQSNVVSYEDHMVIEHKDDIGWDILIRMELLKPFLDYCNEEKLTEDDVLRLGIDICRALELCSRYGIIHRDIKPENIFVSDAGDFKLGDFGISRMIEDSREGLSRKGTYTYMAPEVFNGKAYGPSADIYSLGLVMYKFLNEGRNVFMPAAPNPIVYADKDKAFFKRMAGEPFPDPASGSDELKRIVMKACAFKPEDRYETAAQMREDLEGILFRQRNLEKTGKSEEAAKDEEAALENKTVSPGRKKRRIALIIAAIAVATAFAVFAIRPEKVTGISGIGDSEEILIGDVLAPEYTIEPEGADDVSLSFASDNKDVFTVDKKGRIHALKTGEGILTITAGEYKEDVKITVSPKVKKIKGVNKRIVMYAGDKYRLKPKLFPKKYSKEKIIYKSLKKRIATVSSKGLIRAKKAGVCRIRISAGGCVKIIKVIVKKRPEVVYPAPENYGAQPSYNGGSSGSSSDSSGNSGSSGSGSDSSGSSGSSNKEQNSDSGNNDSGNSGNNPGGSGGNSGEGYFDSDDDEYF
ncbi:MAG: protein kinase [Firmicutes bacterium]|nr:protein kinase [Bacillota bacterium]